MEPFLMLTVLNCFFMLSSTVTSCALWWQYRRHRHSCSCRGSESSTWKIIKSKSCQETGKKCYMSDLIGVANNGKSSVKKRGKSSARSAKESKEDKRNKSSGRSKKSKSKEKREEALEYLEKLRSTEATRQTAASPSSNSTLVMEVSTARKVVQIFDNDPLISRSPNETVTYRFLPENPRKFELFLKNKEDRSTTVDKNSSTSVPS